MRDATEKWSGKPRDWSKIISQLCIYFEDRISLSDIFKLKKETQAVALRLTAWV